MIDLSRFRIATPYDHQIVGIGKMIENPFFFLADEMGAGKTFQVINTALLLADANLINRVIIVTPAAVRSVWFDPELGELSKWLWANFPCTISEYHVKTRKWNWFTKVNNEVFEPKLNWIITNYDFIRNKARLKSLVHTADQKTLLVLDESSAVKNWSSQQTKVCKELRKQCGRVILLNGTPISNNPGDLYAQAEIMDPSILGCKSFFHFRARYAQMGGWQGKQIVGWHDIDDLQKRMAPYVLRRLKADCIDLPAKIDAVPMLVTMTPTTWRIYKEMRDDMVAWLGTVDSSFASQAIVKAIRLAQICSGFIGGVQRQEELDLDVPDYLESGNKLPFDRPAERAPVSEIQEVGREKLDTFLEWVEQQLSNDPNAKILTWSRFRPEVKRTFDELGTAFPKITRGLIWGGQKQAERNAATQILDPRTAPKGPALVLGTPSTGAMGLNLTAANIVMYMSNDFSLKTRLQSEDRVHRPGQIRPVSYFDLVAVGPNGQKTIDHTTIKALRSKEDMADFTTSAWLDILREE